MRFWSPFHKYSLDIISNSQDKFIFRAPNCIRLRMTVDHLELNQNPGSCLTQYNHDTCLWECYHSPSTIGYHRLFLWVLDYENDDQWATAVRFDIYIKQIIESFIYPITTNIFNIFRCQLIKPMNEILIKESLPTDIIIRVPNIHDIQLQLDQNTLIKGKNIQNDIYKIEIPSNIPNNVQNCLLMGLCSNDLFYSILITYKIK